MYAAHMQMYAYVHLCYVVSSTFNFIYVLLCYVNFVQLLMRLSSCLIKGNLLTYLLKFLFTYFSTMLLF